MEHSFALLQTATAKDRRKPWNDCFLWNAQALCFSLSHSLSSVRCWWKLILVDVLYPVYTISSTPELRWKGLSLLYWQIHELYTLHRYQYTILSRNSKHAKYIHVIQLGGQSSNNQSMSMLLQHELHDATRVNVAIFTHESRYTNGAAFSGIEEFSSSCCCLWLALDLDLLSTEPSAHLTFKNTELLRFRG